MPKPSFRDKREVEKYNGDSAAGDEKWLEALSANVGDVSDQLDAFHYCVLVLGDTHAIDCPCSMLEYTG